MSFSDDIAVLVQESENVIHAAAARWARAPLGHVADILNGFPFESEFFVEEGGVRLIRIRDVTAGDTSTFYRGPIPDGYWIRQGDILVGMDGDFTLRVWHAAPGLLNQRVCKIMPRPEVLDPMFLAFVLPGYLRLINEHTHSVTVKHLSSRTLQQVPIPLPSLVEQRRIVAGIEALFARTRRARADLERIAPLADRLNVVSADEAFGTPGTAWTTVGAIATAVQYGSSAKTDDDSSGVPVLRMGNILGGRLDLHKLKYLPRSHSEFPALLLEPGDILFNRTNSADLVGKTAVYLGEPSPCSFASYLIRLRIKGLRSQLLAAYINSPAGRDWAASVVSQQVGQANINGTKLRALRVPVMPDNVQERVEGGLASVWAAGRKITVEATRALGLLDRLEQSILARAFRGELVPQNPSEATVSAQATAVIAEQPARVRRRRAG